MHTQGIWKGETGDHNGQKYVRVFVENENEKRIIFEVPILTDEDLYNCMLMEMAPALLKSCKALVQELKEHDMDGCDHECGICNCSATQTIKEAERHIKLAEGSRG